MLDVTEVLASYLQYQGHQLTMQVVVVVVVFGVDGQKQSVAELVDLVAVVVEEMLALRQARFKVVLREPSIQVAEAVPLHIQIVVGPP
jgi:hypothetical protein